MNIHVIDWKILSNWFGKIFYPKIKEGSVCVYIYIYIYVCMYVCMYV